MLKYRVWLQWGFIALAVGCIALGVSQNQHLLTMEKAIRICLECIGIG